jgi:hypothetical protein
MTQQQRSKKAWSRWGKLVAQQGKSGKSVAGFCRERGLCAPHFFVWKKKLSQGEAARFVEVKVAAAAVEGVAGSDRSIEVRLRNGRSLVVEPGFDAHHVRALMAVVETEA